MNAASTLSSIAAFLRRIRHILIAFAGLYVAWLLFAWLALPPLLQSQSEKYVLARSGHHLTMDKPSFNPFLLRLHLRNLKLAEPDGRPLMSFRDLIVDFSSTSLFRRAYVFDEIALDNLDATLIVLPHNRLNWSGLIEAFRSKEKTPSSELPRLVIRKITLTAAQATLIDRRTAAERSARIEPMALELTDLSTLPNGRGRYEVTAKTSFGATIAWDGVLTLKPILMAGHLRVDGISLPRLAAYMPLPATIAAPEGVAAFATSYRAGVIEDAFNVTLGGLAVRLDGFKIAGKADPSAVATAGYIALTGGRFDLLKRRIAFKQLAVSGGGVEVVRDAKGRINWQALMPKPAQQAAAPQTSVKGGGWHYRIERVSLAGYGVELRDGGANFALQDIAAETGPVSEDLSQPLPVKVSLRSRDGGTFAAEGTVVAAAPSADLQIKLDGLTLAPVQPYLARTTTLKLASGSVSSEGHLVFAGKDADYTGGFAVRNLRILTGDGQVFLAWTSLASTSLAASNAKLAMRELVLDGLDTRLIIAKDKSINFTKIFRTPAAKPAPPQSAPQPATAESAAPAPAAKAAPLFPVNIARLRILRSQMEFADHSLALPFGTHIHALNGTLVNISTRQGGAPARLLVNGQIDNYGTAHGVGLIDLFKPTDNLDIKVDFANVEMARLTPYSATFAGRKIESGKLTLHLQYKIKNRQMMGDNQIIMDKITLGERVQSPQAKDLPLELAIAILEDSDGRIDLGLPVSGSLDDPKFSYGGIIWKAITNVLTKIVTAPFRALGALFGGDDKFDGIVFAAGSPALSPPEQEKLAAFAAGLKKHPKLAVTLHGTWSEADRAALQDLQLRRQIAAKLGLSTEGDPGLLTPDQPNVKEALEALYAGKFGNGGLAAMREGFGKANPGKLETGTSGRMMAIFTGIIGSKKDLSATEVADLKGADFHAVLYRKLVAAEVVTDAALQQLAQARGTLILNELQKAQAPMDRIKLDAVAKAEADGKDVPLKVDMAPVPDQAVQPAHP
ncbi:DUF748 domain-containing protein [Rhizomicrobium electricum]|uniref:DUF748 domain-containing protein n=1 Tax=Rhizomicrobium electricum TaxID=480070 RepID=A0ABP3PH57_9PROT|nr:DUF748 domain-containing protein [Rhizomicrobium electricum]NIJ48674.1 hypothetical protein [Rhizomicrobium electricum]